MRGTGEAQFELEAPRSKPEATQPAKDPSALASEEKLVAPVPESAEKAPEPKPAPKAHNAHQADTPAKLASDSTSQSSI